MDWYVLNSIITTHVGSNIWFGTHLPGAGVALGKGEVGDRPRPHLKIRPHPKTI
jgi:hypothetical protein